MCIRDRYLAGAFGRVYEIGSVYRAERHNTSRHLNEYMGLDFEMAYIDSMYDVMAMETGMLKSVMAYVKEHCAEELAMLNAEVPEIKEIPTIRFHEAKQIMEELSLIHIFFLKYDISFFSLFLSESCLADGLTCP